MSATPLGKLLQDEIKEMARWIENNLSEEPVRLNKVGGDRSRSVATIESNALCSYCTR